MILIFITREYRCGIFYPAAAGAGPLSRGWPCRPRGAHPPGDARNEAHNALQDKVIELLGWLGGSCVQNLDKPLANLSGTPCAGRHRPDLRAEEAGRAPVYVDVCYSHWWSLGESAAAAAGSSRVSEQRFATSIVIDCSI